jgi:hypothetical protein
VVKFLGLRMTEEEVQALLSAFFSAWRLTFYQNFLLAELATVVKFLGMRMTEEEVQALFDEFDEDGSGSIEFDEFLLLIIKKVTISDVEPHHFYAALDKNSDATPGHIRTVKRFRI